MPYSYAQQEELKNHVRFNESKIFIEKFEAIKEEDRKVWETYLYGKEDEGRSLMSWAAYSGSRELIEYLYKQAPNLVNHQDGKGRTPITFAISEEHPVAVETLIDLGADVNKPDRLGETPLHVAIHYFNLKIFDNLLSAGADVFAVDCNESNVLHLAARYNFPALHYLFLKRGDKVKDLINAKNENGDTPLHLAAENEDGLAAKYLLLRGADKNIKNNYGETPYQEADPGSQAAKFILSAKKAVNEEEINDFYNESMLKEVKSYGENALSYDEVENGGYALGMEDTVEFIEALGKVESEGGSEW